jgi:uncharacterized cupin superfamily protein
VKQISDYKPSTTLLLTTYTLFSDYLQERVLLPHKVQLQYDIKKKNKDFKNQKNMSPVPLTIIKGAGAQHIPIPSGESAIVADFHSIQTKTTDTPTYLTSGFYRIIPGPTRDIPTYPYEETKYVLNGQIDVLDEATGVTHHLVQGDWAFFHVSFFHLRMCYVGIVMFADGLYVGRVQGAV